MVLDCFYSPDSSGGATDGTELREQSIMAARRHSPSYCVRAEPGSNSRVFLFS